jgi:predicted GH43/DUF377 family glycosyl hydrolase
MRRAAPFVAMLAVAQMACGPAWQPRQARFIVEGCEAIAAGEPETWRWTVGPEPVLRRGPAGAWDAVDVLNPSVVERDGRFYNFYSGFDGAIWHTGLAVSGDGHHWQKLESNPVLSPRPDTWEGRYMAANGTAVHDGRQFLYWYQAGEPAHLGLARSRDGRNWERHGPPVLGPGPAGTWDEAGVGDPYVIRCGETYYLYYLGQTGRGVQRLGVARSLDGVHWQKFLENPILEVGPPGSFDEQGLGEPAVFYSGSEFFMIYTGRDKRENRRLGVARSGDGVHWRRAPLPETLAGGQPWNAKVVCDPALWAGRGKLWLWFGGGDVPSPDENLNGQIGLATLELR